MVSNLLRMLFPLILDDGFGLILGCVITGQCGQGLAAKEHISESHLMDLLHGSEYVLTYEDKDGDWMLVGDVPWE